MTKTRHIPANYIEFNPKYTLAGYREGIVSCYVDRERPVGMFFIGKRSLPEWHNRFTDNESMKRKFFDYIGRVMSNEDFKAKRIAERKAAHTLAVGNILYSAWGYDQTNIDFYQVTKVISGHTVEIRQIAGTHSGTDHVVPCPDQFLSPRNEYDKTGLTMTKRVSAKNTITLNSYSSAWLWDGKPKYETPFGSGH